MSDKQITHKLHIKGFVDKIQIDQHFEFTKTDKGALIDLIDKRTIGGGSSSYPLLLRDIHGQVFFVDFSKVKVFNLTITEIFD